MVRFNWDKASIETLKIDEHISSSLEALNRLEAKRQSKEIGFMDLPSRTSAVKDVNEKALWIRNNCKDFIVLGIGGSSLGGKTILSALTNTYVKHSPTVNIIDNVDPDYFNDLLESIDIKSTIFNVISKSGSTAETMSQFLVIYDMLKKHLNEKEARNRIVLTTDPQKGILRELANSMGFKALEVPGNVGGRFSVLSEVGLLPAAVAGVDIKALLDGASEIASHSFNKDINNNPVLKYSLIKYLHSLKGKHVSVLMPYSSKLSNLSSWYVQLWAESLGKKGKGQTPIPSVGAVDQHSQLQLFMEGPKDKFITFVGVEQFNRDIKIPAFDKKADALDYLGGHTMQELIRAEMISTERALHENGVPSIRIEVPTLDAHHVGNLLMLFEIAVALTGEFMGIYAFDQPGVELSKKYTYQMMGRKGY